MQLQIPLPAQQIILLAQQEYPILLGLLIHSQGLNKIDLCIWLFSHDWNNWKFVMVVNQLDRLDKRQKVIATGDM